VTEYATVNSLSGSGCLCSEACALSGVHIMNEQQVQYKNSLYYSKKALSIRTMLI